MLVQWDFSNTFCKILKIQTVCLLLGEYMFFQKKKKNLEVILATEIVGLVFHSCMYKKN